MTDIKTIKTVEDLKTLQVKDKISIIIQGKRLTAEVLSNVPRSETIHLRYKKKTGKGQRLIKSSFSYSHLFASQDSTYRLKAAATGVAKVAAAATVGVGAFTLAGGPGLGELLALILKLIEALQ